MDRGSNRPAAAALSALREEIRRSAQSRYDHRLHAVLMSCRGLGCREIAGLLGDAPRTIHDWLRRSREKGFAGLMEAEREGRPTRLGAQRLCDLQGVLRQPPSAVGMRGQLWRGDTLCEFIERRYAIRLSVRQCQRILAMSKHLRRLA